MKTGTQKQNTIEGNVDLQGQEFEIAATGHAFEILSKNIYSDVPRAIIREVLFNAVDAHTRSNCKDDVELYLPTAADPTVKIADHGIGMTHKDVMDVYRNFFKSTKQNNNRETGMLGLGAKTPFAYTNQFTVVTSRGGSRRTYLMLKNEEGIPTVNLISDEKDDLTGTVVEIPINTADASTFYDATLKTIPFMKKMPVIARGSMEFYKHAGGRLLGKDTQQAIEDIHSLIYSGKQTISVSHTTSDDNLGNNILAIAKSISSSPLAVIMGGVYYTVDMSSLKVDESVEHPLFPISLYGVKIAHVKIGDIDFQPSREALNYSERTMTLVKGIFNRDFDDGVRSLLSKNSLTEIGAIPRVDMLVNLIADKCPTIRPQLEDKFRTLANEIANLKFFLATVEELKTYRDKKYGSQTIEKRLQSYKRNTGSSIAVVSLGLKLIDMIQGTKPKAVITISGKPLEKMVEKSLRSEDFAIPACFKTKTDLINRNEYDILLASQDAAEWLSKKLNPAMAKFATYESLTVKKAHVRNPANRSDHSAAKAMVSVINPMQQFTIDEVLQLLDDGTYDRVLYELYTGEGPDEGNGKTCWNEYVMLNAMQKENVKKSEATFVKSNSKGFSSITKGMLSNPLTVAKGLMNDDNYSLLPPKSLEVAIRWKDFVNLRLWERPKFYQAIDFKLEAAVNKLNELKTRAASLKLEPTMTLLNVSEAELMIDMLISKNISEKSVAIETLTKFINVDTSVCKSAAGLRIDSSRLTAFVIEIRKLYKTINKDPPEMDVTDICDKLTTLSQSDSHENYNKILANAYPMTRFVNWSANKKDIVDYIALVEGSK
jgi:hypothetical protein